jgi:hypothetical protein
VVKRSASRTAPPCYCVVWWGVGLLLRRQRLSSSGGSSLRAGCNLRGHCGSSLCVGGDLHVLRSCMRLPLCFQCLRSHCGRSACVGRSLRSRQVQLA